MNLGTKTSDDMLSKDFNVAYRAAGELINNKDTESFKKLADNSEFIFDFLKEKIKKNLLDNVSEENYKNILEFTKIYSEDFEDFVVCALTEYANEDLTDEICELFEKGSDEQKAYCARYFYYINDTVALELLNKYAKSEFLPLAFNCAKTLAKFNDRKLYNEYLNTILSSLDEEDDSVNEFENMQVVNFLVNYGDKDAFYPLYKYMKKSLFSQEIAVALLNLKTFDEIMQNKQIEVALEIYDRILSAYPEFLSLNTLEDYGIFKFIYYLLEIQDRNSFISRIILKTKLKFDLFVQEDIYTYDLGKDTKELIIKTDKLVNLKQGDYYSNLGGEIYSDDTDRICEVFNIIAELKIDNYKQDILRLIRTSKNEILICEGTKTLKELGAIDLVNKDELENKISNPNILALLNSYFI